MGLDKAKKNVSSSNASDFIQENEMQKKGNKL